MERLDRWHKTQAGLLIFGLIELLVAYGFLSLAIDRGSWWWYLLTVISLVGGMQNIGKFIIGTSRNGRRK